MTKADRPTIDPSLSASLHQVGGRWNAVLVRKEADGLRLVETKSFSSSLGGESIAASVRQWLVSQQCGRVVGVLPATSVICRTSQLPNGATERLIPALRLQAEGHLLGDVPSHRLGMAIMPQANGEASRTGVIVAWPLGNALSDAALAIDRTLGIEHTWIPETAALAALVGSARVPGPVIWCDRTSGAVSILLAHRGGLLLRSAREENGSADDWIAGIGRIVADSALGSGIDGEDVGTMVTTVQTVVGDVADGNALVMPPELEHQLPGLVAGVPSDRTWWQTHGMGLGAVIAVNGPLAELGSLRRKPPIERPSPAALVASRLSQPRVAALLAAAAFALIVAWPVVAATVRLAILESKAPELRAVEIEVQELERTLAMYRSLAEQVLPMHKLLADIANSTPDGIELDQLSISRGDGISIRGQANRRDGRTAEELVLLMTARMNETRIFDQTSPSWDTATAAGTIAFRLSSRVTRPYQMYDYPPEWDFGVETLADRRYGRQESATVQQPPPVEVADATPPRGGSPSRPSGGGRSPATPVDQTAEESTLPDDDVVVSGERPLDQPGDELADQSGERPVRPSDGRVVGRRGTGEAAGAATRTGRPGLAQDDIPEPLSATQIRSMSRSEAQGALERVARARLRRDLDEEISARLHAEFDLLLEQTRRAQ